MRIVARRFLHTLDMMLIEFLLSLLLLDIYSIKEVYSRNHLCSITGALLEIKALDVAANFMVSNKLRPSPSKLQKGLHAINSAMTAAGNDDEDD